MEGGIRTSQPAGPAVSVGSADGQARATARMSRSQTSYVASGKGKIGEKGKSRATKYAAVSSIAAYAGKAAAVSELDDEATKMGELRLTSDDAQEGLSGEERLQRVTSKPGMMGLLKFTQHGSTKDIRKVGVSPEILQRVVIEDEWQLMSCMQLPTTIVFFIMFMLFFQQHYGTSYIHLQESNLRANFGDAAWEVDDIDGIYGWFKDSLFAYAYSTDLSLGKDPAWQSDLGGAEYQEWVAAVMVRTQRAEIKPCDSDYVREFNCSYMTMGAKKGKVDKQGKSLQELPNEGGFIGGWDRTDSRRLQAIADSDGKAAPENRTWVEAFYGSDAKPTTRIEWIAHKLTSWWPRQKTFRRAGKWIKPKHLHKTSEPTQKTAEENIDAIEAAINAITKDAKVARASKEAVAKKLASLKDQQEKGEKTRKLARRARKHKKKKGYKGRKLEGVYPPPRRLDDVVIREDPSKKAKKVHTGEYDGVAEPRQLRQTRTEFGTFGWIPYAYVTTDVWEYVFPMSLPQEEAFRTLDAWQEDAIIDRGTLFFGVEVMFRNPTMPVSGLLTHCFINFIFSRGGHIYVEVTMQSLVLSNSRLSVLAFAFIWISTLIVNSISTPARLCAAWKRGGWSSVTAHLKRLWNILEWFLISCGWIIVVAFMAERYGMMKFDDHWDDYTDGRRSYYRNAAASPNNAQAAAALQDYDRKWFDQIRENIMNTGNIDVWLQVIVAHYHNFLIWRFFIASRGQPRLAMYLKTIFDAATDLLHLGVVIGIIFIAYVVSGHILFGRRLESFSTLEGSLAYCIQIVLQKEFDYQTLTMQDFWTVSVWVWSFVILIVLVLVNMVLAMIFDTYADVRNNLNDSDTMFHTIQTIFKQVKLYSVWISNRDLVMAVKKMQGEQVTAGKLREQVPGISNVQVQHLFDAAKIKLETLMTKGNKNALPEAVASILIGVDELKAGVKVMAGEERPREASMIDGGVDSASMENYEAPGSAQPTPRLTTSEIPSEGPLWLRQGLLPHLRRQEKFMDQVHAEIQGIDQKIKSKGVGAGLPESPFETPSMPWEDASPVIEPVLKLPEVNEFTRRVNNIVAMPPDSSVTGAGKVGRTLESA